MAARIAVTGATGFVGWRVAEHLRDSGVAVRALVRIGNRKPVPEGVEVREVALAPAGAGAAGSCADALGGCDAVVHAAGVIRAATQAGFDAVNVEGTRTMVTAANAAGARFVLISSLAAIGPGTAARPAREDDEPRPVNAYGRSKLAAEQVVRQQARVPWTIIRPPAVYGPRDRGFLPLHRLASRGIFIGAVPRAMPFSFVYIDDLAHGVALAAIEPGASRHALFVAHPQVITSEDLLRELARVYARTFRLWQLPALAVGAAARFGDLSWRLGTRPLLDSGRLQEFRATGFVCATDRARELLGFCADVPMADGLARTAAWYRRAHWVRDGSMSADS